jgi:hypothetical protein
MRTPSIYERVEIINRRSEWMPIGHTAKSIHEAAEWVTSKGAAVQDACLDGFRYQNADESEWRWVNPGQWMHFYNGIEFDHPSDSAPWDLSSMEHVSGPILTSEDDEATA